MNKIVRKNYPELGEVKAPYVHAVKHNNTLYISGLTAFGTAAQQAGMAEQAEEVFRQPDRAPTAFWIFNDVPDTPKVRLLQQSLVLISREAGVIKRLPLKRPNGFAIGRPGVEHQPRAMAGMRSKNCKHPPLIGAGKVKKTVPGEDAIETALKI